MNFLSIGVFVLAALLAFAALTIFDRMRMQRAAARGASLVSDVPLVASVPETTERAKLLPEGLYVVELTEWGVTCARPDQSIERVSWEDLQRVEIVNTDEGPLAIDVYWVLHGSNGGCVIPQGASGEQELLERLQALPGFDNQAVIRSMALTSNERSVCWQRSA